jgi:carboxymethylenebutenolidase
MLTILVGVENYAFAGLVPFYAGLSRPIEGGRGTALEVAPQVRHPMLGLFGGDDPGIPPDKVAELDVALDGTGVPHEIIIYPGAPHGFFDRQQTEFAQESADAWGRVLDFILASRS